MFGFIKQISLNLKKSKMTINIEKEIEPQVFKFSPYNNGSNANFSRLFYKKFNILFLEI